MPEIPEITGLPETAQTKASPQLFALPYETATKGAMEARESAEYGAKIFGFLALRNKKAAMEVQAAKLDNIIDEGSHDIAFKIGQMTNYNDVDGFIKNSLKSLGDKMDSETLIYSGDGAKEPIPELQAAVEKSLLHYSGHLRQIGELKKAELIDRDKMFNFDALYQSAIGKYINESNPVAKEAIKTELRFKAMAINNPYAMNKVMQFDGHADESQYRLDISKNPLSAYEKINEVDEKGNYKNYPNLDPTKRAELIEHNLRTINLQDEVRERSLDMDEKFRKHKAEDVLTSLAAKSMKGQDIQQDLQVLADSRVLDAQEVKSALDFEKTWTAAMKKEDATENEALKSQLALGIYGSRLTVSEKELTAALQANSTNPGTGINAQTYREFLGHRTAMMKENQRDAKSDRLRDYENGARDIDRELTTTGPLEKLDPISNVLKADASREFYKLVFKDGVPVNDAVSRITDKYTKALATAGDADTKALRKTLNIPGINSSTASVGDMAISLDQNKKNMPSATYEAQRRMLLRIKMVEDAQDQAKKLRLQKQKPTTEGGGGGY